MKINDIPEHSNQRSCRSRRNESQNPHSAARAKTSPRRRLSPPWPGIPEHGGGWPGSRPRWLHCGLGELPGWESDASCREGLRGGRGPCSASQHAGPLSPATRRTCLPRAGPCCRRGQSHGACWTGRGRGLRVQTWVSSCKQNSGRPCLSPCSLLGASP